MSYSYKSDTSKYVSNFTYYIDKEKIFEMEQLVNFNKMHVDTDQVPKFELLLCVASVEY